MHTCGECVFACQSFWWETDRGLGLSTKVVGFDNWSSTEVVALSASACHSMPAMVSEGTH